MAQKISRETLMVAIQTIESANFKGSDIALVYHSKLELLAAVKDIDDAAAAAEVEEKARGKKS